MKIVLSQVLNFPVFFNEISNKKLHVKTLYKIFQLKQKTEETIKFYQENLEQIISEYAMRDEKGKPKKDSENSILISKDQIDECTQRIQELTNLLIDFPDIYFNMEEFNNIESSFEIFEPIFFLIKI